MGCLLAEKFIYPPGFVQLGELRERIVVVETFEQIERLSTSILRV